MGTAKPAELPIVRRRPVALAALLFPVLLMLVLMLTTPGCGLLNSPGRITYTATDGTSVEVEQPGKSVTPASVAITSEAGVTTHISTGARQKQTPAMIAAGQTWTIYLIGAGLMLVGIGLIVAKKYIPVLPTTAGTYTIAAGVAIIVLAYALPAIPGWAWLIGGAAALGVGAWLIVPGLISNREQQQQNGAPEQ